MIALALGLLLALVPASPAGAQETCEVSVDRTADDSLVATASPGCGSVNVAVFSYDRAAPGVWSPGAFDFDLTLPQTLRGSATGVGSLGIDLPCGAFQVDVWQASGPPIPSQVTNGFLADNYADILGSMLAGYHGQRNCVHNPPSFPPTGPTGPNPPTGPTGPTGFSVGGVESSQPFTNSPFLSTGPISPLDQQEELDAEEGVAPPVVAGDSTRRMPGQPRVQILQAGAGGAGSGQIALSLIVASVLVAIVFRTPLPSAATQRWFK